jgi:hypothetical protein
MELFNAKHILEGLDELSVDNLQSEPPRITSQSLAFAIEKIKAAHKDISITENSMGTLYLAEQLNDMLIAAKVIRTALLNEMEKRT